jgi:hypothetical protein
MLKNAAHPRPNGLGDVILEMVNPRKSVIDRRSHERQRRLMVKVLPLAAHL